MPKIISPLSFLLICAVAGVSGFVTVGAVVAQPSVQPGQAQVQNATVPAATTNNNAPVLNSSASVANNGSASDASSKGAQVVARKICRTTPQTGTRLRALRTCRTEEEWRQSATETQKAVRVMQGRGAVPAGN
jgi:cytoskeletal protein RodZ